MLNKYSQGRLKYLIQISFSIFARISGKGKNAVCITLLRRTEPNLHHR